MEGTIFYAGCECPLSKYFRLFLNYVTIEFHLNGNVKTFLSICLQLYAVNVHTYIYMYVLYSFTYENKFYVAHAFIYLVIQFTSTYFLIILQLSTFNNQNSILLCRLYNNQNSILLCRLLQHR